MAGLLLPPAVNIEPSKESSSLCRRLAFDVFILTGLDGLCIFIYLKASVFSFISLMAEGWTYFFSVCTGHLYIIICNLSVNIPRPFINWMNPVLLFNLLSSLYVLCITPLLDGHLTYFSYPLGFPLLCWLFLLLYRNFRNILIRFSPLWELSKPCPYFRDYQNVIQKALPYEYILKGFFYILL